jgi:hypothetical protein
MLSTRSVFTLSDPGIYVRLPVTGQPAADLDYGKSPGSFGALDGFSVAANEGCNLFTSKKRFGAQYRTVIRGHNF